MTERNGVVKGLRDQECERGNIAKRPLIPYVPVTDEVQDALNINHKERLQKIKLPNGTEFNASIWYTGTPKEFLNHVKQAVHACERLGYFSNYQPARKAHGDSKKTHAEAVSEYETALEDWSTDSNAVANRNAILEGERPGTAQPPGRTSREREVPWHRRNVPQETRKLLLVLENIEKLNANEQKKSAANSAGTNAKAADTNGKRKGMNSSADRIPKKKRTEKHCVLCPKYGEGPASHNTKECTKYDKDGTLKASWGTKSAGTG